MPSINKVILIGHLGSDPEKRFMPNGNATCRYSVATSETWKDKNGEKQEHTEWHRIVMFGKIAETACEYLKKGAAVYIEGRLRTQEWTDKENIKRYTTEIIADTMKMLGKRDKAEAKTSNSTQPDTDIDDDIPF